MFIPGGTEADLYEFPHQALLGYNEGDPGEWGCGGSLISPNFVMTGKYPLIFSYDPMNWMSSD